MHSKRHDSNKCITIKKKKTHRTQPRLPKLRAFPTHFISILYFTSSKTYFFNLATHFYKTPHNPFSILQNI